MRTLMLVVVALAFTGFVAAKDDKKELVRELELKAAKLEPQKGAKVGEPTKVTSKAELAKAVEDKDAADAIAKLVDFEKEYVLIFAWAGSGGDKLTAAVDKDAVIFSVKRGLTKDLRQHAHVFAVAKNAEWSMAK